MNFQVHNGTIEKEKNEKRDFRVKTQKGSLERKRDFRRLMSRTDQRMRVNNQEESGASTSFSIPSKIEEFESSIRKCLSRIPKSITMGLDAHQIAIFRD